MTSVAVLGKGSLAIKASQWFLDSPRFELVGVVPVVPEPAWTQSFEQWAREARIPVAESGTAADALSFPSTDGRLGLALSVFYDRILRPSFLDECDRALNLHNAPLPRYRGVSPINWALKNGEVEHGVTLHEITPGIDDGAIVAQAKFSIDPVIDEVQDVYERALDYGWLVLQHALPRLDRLTARPQDEACATYYSRNDDAALQERRGFRRA